MRRRYSQKTARAILSLILTACLLMFVTAPAIAAGTKPELRFRSDGSFKILMFSDVQETFPVNQRTIDAMNSIINAENPDFVMLTGDITHGSVTTEANFNSYLTQVVTPMESRGIPWAHVYGNHDEDHTASTGLTKELQQTIYEAYPHCLSQRGPTDIGGVGNYVLPVKASTGDNVVFNLWGLDSNKYLSNDTWYNGNLQNDAVLPNGLQGNTGYNFISYPQIMWYWNTSNQMESTYSHKIPGLMFFHIALPETRLIHMNPSQTGMTGYFNEPVCNSPINNGLFSAVLQRGDVKGIYCGHDHTNTFDGTYCGIKLGYDGSIGYSTYGTDNIRGARVFLLNEANPSQFTTWMRFASEVGNTADILDINYDTATVTGSAVTDLSPSGNNGTLEGNASIAYDSTFRQKALSLNGTNSLMRVEGSAASFNTQNVSVETTFKVNTLGKAQEVFGKSNNSDYCLEINSTNTLSFMVRTGTSYKVATTTQMLQANRVYHAVGTYDGTNVKLYLDGVLAATTACTGPIVVNTGIDFLVGADPGENTDATLFLDGKVGLIRIYSYALTADNVAALKVKSIPKPDILDINYDTAVVTGSSVNDSSPSNNDGVLEGNAAIQQDGILNQKALVLDGTNSLMRVESNNASFNLQNVTVHSKFTLSRLGQVQEVFGKSQGSDYCMEVGSNNKLSFWVRTNGTYKIVTTTQALAENTVYNVVGTYNGSTVKLFLNGQSAGSLACTGAINVDSTVDFLVGADPEANNSASLFLSGKVGLIGIYSFPLNDADALALSK